MDKILKFPISDYLRYEAACWLTILDREPESEDDIEKFRVWLNQSDKHRAAFESLSSLSTELSILKDLDDIGVGILSTTPQQRGLSRRTFIGATASSVAVMIGGLWFTYNVQKPKLKSNLATAVGEQKSSKLPDGSSILLNTDSQVEIDFSLSQRIITLARGEAYFNVAKDSNRPFSVYFNGGKATAVGTAFSVRLRGPNDVELTVEEGRVVLAKQIDLPLQHPLNPRDIGTVYTPIAQLTDNQTTVFKDNVEIIRKVSTGTLERKLAWREGMLMYTGESLTEVVEEISRYTTKRIELVGPELHNLRVAGYFQIADIEGSIESLSKSFNLKIEHVTNDYIRLISAT